MTDEHLVRETTDKLLAGIDGASPRDAWGATFDAGLSRVDFPVGLGGLGVRPELQWIVDDALAAAGVPSGFPQNISGMGVVAPVLAAFGTAQQQDRYLRPIYTCDDIWCQLFSEPDAGSDVASLRTRAVPDGDGWRVTGQKVWNTMAHIADVGLLLARTSDAPRHKGITCFLLDMHTSGVEVRPLRQMTGDAEFNEVLFDGALVPDEARVGAVNEGWSVALGTLMAERYAVNKVLDSETPFVDEIVGLWRSLDDPRRRPQLRQRLVQTVIRSRLQDLMRARLEADAREGVHGPEGSIMKLLQSELTPDVFDLGLDLLGADGMLYGAYDVERPTSWSEAGAKPGDVRRAFLRSRAYPIEGGTVEIQRNTIGERILGLPRDR
ncbi:MAG: hypothetical protein V7636_408 [Actinomycetota bacterium]|jgi:alkylation response protein AidB-like acyl-CoA dehydrogenase